MNWRWMVKRLSIVLGLTLCCLTVSICAGCQDISTAGSTTSTLLETTTSLAETTTSAGPQTTTTTSAGAGPRAGVTTTTKPASSIGALPEPTPKVKLLKGTWAWDVDADVDGVGPNADVWYRIVSEVEHYLEPQNGAAFARISKPFDAVTRADLQGATYRSGRLATEGVDDLNVLNAGDVIALRTSTGQYAKLEVAGYEPYTASDGMTYNRYNIRLRYVLYPR